MKKRPSTKSKKVRHPVRSRTSAPVRASRGRTLPPAPAPPAAAEVASEKKPANSPMEQTIIDMAETMGRLVGEGEIRWKQWVKEPNAVRDSLMTIRDKATHLLLEMRTSALSGFSQTQDDDDGGGVRVQPAPPVARRRPARPGR